MADLSKRRPWTFAALVFAVPLLQYVFLRRFLHDVLGLSIGWNRWLTDFDLILPFPTAFFLFIAFHPDTPTTKLKARPFAIGFNATMLLLFVAFNCALSAFDIPVSGYWKDAWWLGALAVLGSAFFLWVPVRFFIAGSHLRLALLCAPIALSTVFAAHFFGAGWDWAGPKIAGSVQALSTSVSSDLTCFFRYHTIYLRHPLLKFRLEQGCGGLDAFLLGAYAVVVLLLRYRRQFGALHTLVLSIFACGLMLLLNAVRITAIMALGMLLTLYWGTESASTAMLFLFHTYAGWILYLLGIHQICLFGRWLAFHSPQAEQVLATRFGRARISR